MTDTITVELTPDELQTVLRVIERVVSRWASELEGALQQAETKLDLALLEYEERTQ